LKGFYKGFKLALRPWELSKNWWRYDQMKFVTDSVYYLYMKSNPNLSSYPVLPYESLSSHMFINKKIKEKKKKRKIIIRN